MPRRLIAFIRGTSDAMPGDYVLALIAVLGLMVAITTELLVAAVS